MTHGDSDNTIVFKINLQYGDDFNANSDSTDNSNANGEVSNDVKEDDSNQENPLTKNGLPLLIVLVISSIAFYLSYKKIKSY